MYKNLAVLLLVLFSALCVGGQTIGSAKETEAAAKLEKDAVEFLRETSLEVDRLRTPENRISFSAELASLMWFHDEKEAKVMYGGVVSDFKQLLAQFDMQMNNQVVDPDDDGSGGGNFLFGGYGRNKVERKFRIAMAVRQQIATSLAEHAPDLAYNFFYDSRDLISNPEFKKQTEQSDKYFEARLMQQIADSDADKAAEYGKESIKRGLDDNHIELLKKIYAKDADKGIEFGQAILSRLKSDKLDSPNADYFYRRLLSFGSANLAASKKTGGKKPVYDQNDLRDIADQFAQFLLDAKVPEDEAIPQGDVEQIEKYSPGRAAQIRAKYKNNSTSLGNTDARAVRAMRLQGFANGANSAANVSTSANSNSAANTAQQAREAREKAEAEMMENVKDLGSKPLPKEQRDKVVAEARKIISQTPGKDKKIVALSLLAAQVAKAGDKDLADEIMNDAERMVNPQPRNYQDYLLSWMLASGYAEANPDKAFPLLEATILRANDTIAAFVKVGEFLDTNDEMIDDGEVQVGSFGGEMIRGITGELGMASGTIRSLAKADFAKTKNLANTFDRPEVRVLAKMLVLRSVLDKGKKSSNDKDATDDDIMAIPESFK